MFFCVISNDRCFDFVLTSSSIPSPYFEIYISHKRSFLDGIIDAKKKNKPPNNQTRTSDPPLKRKNNNKHFDS